MPTTTARYFAHAHLPPKLQTVAQPLSLLAASLEQLLPDGPEKSAGMRKLLEAKDCFVRVALDMPEPQAGAVPAHQQRVLDEKQELDARIAKLGEFIQSNPLFLAVDADEQARLRRQLDVMHELAVILADRIAHF